MAKARRGRPKQAQAKRRATTRAGRAPAIDLGTDQIRRLRQILNPGQPGLPADPLSALYSRGLVDEPSYNAGRYFAVLVTITRAGWNLKDGSVAYLYRRMVAAVGNDAVPPVGSTNGHDTSAADHFRDRLAAMRAELLAADPTGAMLQTVMFICVDGEWAPWLKRFLAIGAGNGNGNIPGDYRVLGALRDGLQRLAELENPGSFAGAHGGGVTA